MGDVRRIDGDRAEQAAVTLDDLAREGARRMIATALEAEVSEYVASFTEELDEDGKRLVVRNGRARERRLTVGSGQSAFAPLASTTSASMRKASARSSARRSCPPTRAARRR